MSHRAEKVYSLGLERESLLIPHQVVAVGYELRSICSLDYFAATGGERVMGICKMEKCFRL